MPVQNYDIGNYVNDLLRKIGFQDENIIDVEFVNKVVDNTIGGNPRTIKRLINSLALIKIVNDEAEDDDDNEDEIATDEELMIERKLLFSLVCLQIASADIYSLLNKESDFTKWNNDTAFKITQGKENDDEKFKQNFESITKEELLNMKSTIVGSTQVGYDTTAGISRAILSSVVNKGGVKYLDEYANKIENITLEEVNEAIKKHIKTDLLYKVAAGSIDQNGDPLNEQQND